MISPYSSSKPNSQEFTLLSNDGSKFKSLPLELHYIIFKNCSVNTLRRLKVCSFKWKCIIENPSFWKFVRDLLQVRKESMQNMNDLACYVNNLCSRSNNIFFRIPMTFTKKNKAQKSMSATWEGFLVTEVTYVAGCNARIVIGSKNGKLKDLFKIKKIFDNRDSIKFYSTYIGFTPMLDNIDEKKFDYIKINSFDDLQMRKEDVKFWYEQYKNNGQRKLPN